MHKEDWVLMAVCFAHERGLSPVQLQKVLFLLGAELRQDVGDFYDFIPHNYGPFSKQVYSDAEKLASVGLVAIERERTSYSRYIITVAGRDRALQLEREASPRAVEYLANVVAWAQKQSFSGLVQAIYEKYPQYRVNSVFQY